ncbi:hypothetical protein TNCV_3849401 [Trichonephila clavipes]|uniref:Uncharacterized protein n=1 Tax=Trichonephila clavipes TaxID=2585209 RepID=A0A8X6R912_TRICX|nr:hypothetical protein TNCV_3849401 [Trichonephila clavipes]
MASWNRGSKTPTQGKHSMMSYNLQMLDTNPFRSKDQTSYRPIVHPHKWNGNTVGRAGCKCVPSPPIRGDEGHESDPLLEFKGVGLELKRDLAR